MKSLKKEINERETVATTSIINNSRVILCTLTGAALKHVQSVGTYDLLIIDEAAQSIEAANWIPMLFAKKVVLAGDHKQYDYNLLCFTT